MYSRLSLVLRGPYIVPRIELGTTEYKVIKELLTWFFSCHSDFQNFSYLLIFSYLVVICHNQTGPGIEKHTDIAASLFPDICHKSGSGCSWEREMNVFRIPLSSKEKSGVKSQQLIIKRDSKFKRLPTKTTYGMRKVYVDFF